MREIMNRWRRQWQVLPAPTRQRLLVGTVLAMAFALPMLSSVLADSRERQAHAIAEADARLEGVLAAVAEIQRLRRDVPASATLVTDETVRAACRGAGLAVEVRREGADRLRLAGTVDFDRALLVLATLHRDYRLRVLTLAANGDGGAVKLDVLLGADS